MDHKPPMAASRWGGKSPLDQIGRKFRPLPPPYRRPCRLTTECAFVHLFCFRPKSFRLMMTTIFFVSSGLYLLATKLRH